MTSELEREAARRRALLAQGPKHADVADVHRRVPERMAILRRIHDAATAATSEED